MISRILIASMLAGSSVSGSAQEAVRSADGATAYWPHMHQCTLDAVSNFAINTKGTGAQSGRSITHPEIVVTRIDLQVSGTPGGSPTITAHAINTKGTGAAGRSINEIGIAVKSGRASNDMAINTKGTGQSSGRMSGALSNHGPVAVACVTSQLSGDAAAQKVSISSFNFMGRNARSVGWSCSVSGSEDSPVFSVGLLVPTTLSTAQPTVIGKAARFNVDPYAETISRWGMSNRVSIVPRGTAPGGGESFACASTEPRKTNYDLAMMSKV